jgi:hypothetical protein
MILISISVLRQALQQRTLSAMNVKTNDLCKAANTKTYTPCWNVMILY